MSTAASRLLLASLVLFPALSCASGGATVYRPEGNRLSPLATEALLKEGPSEEWSQGVQVRNLGGNDRASAHIVWIRTAEKLHTHAKHEATVLLLKGKGTLWFAGQEIKMKEGDVATITRGLVHGFRNESKDPSAAYVVFTPPFDGRDVVEVGDVVR